MADQRIEIDLPTDASHPVRLIHLGNEHSGCPMYYPQAVRAWPEASAKTCGATYDFRRKHFAQGLGSLVTGEFDCILAPPSRHDFAGYYKDELASGRSALDISSRFHKTADVVAGQAETTAADIYEALAYDAQGDEHSWSSVLIVDDVFASGKTVAAVLSRLRDAGLASDVSVTVAALLRISGKPKEIAPPQGDATG